MKSKFEQLKEQITKEELDNYYVVENHTLNETLAHFNISNSLFVRLRQFYGIKKPSNLYAQNTCKSKLERYGSSSYNNREKSKETCLSKYGVDNPFKDTQKIKQSYIDTLGVDHPMHKKELVDKMCSHRDYKESIRKGQQTYFERTGYTNCAKDPRVIERWQKTKKENGTFNVMGTSQIEKTILKLVEDYYKDKVLSHYKDDRYKKPNGYKYLCDGYVKGQDLFIEVNAHPTHYAHPFDATDEDDIKHLYELNKNLTPWNKQVVDTWTIRDVEKIKCAKENNLNFIVIYPSSNLETNIKINNFKYIELLNYIFDSI